MAAALGTGRARPFRYRTLGLFVDLGRRRAVAQTLGVRWRGVPAWFLARTYHMATMSGAKRKLRLTTDLTAGLAFGRDAAELGQLGHPPELDEFALTKQSAGGTRASDGATADRRFTVDGPLADETGQRMTPQVPEATTPRP